MTKPQMDLGIFNLFPHSWKKGGYVDEYQWIPLQAPTPLPEIDTWLLERTRYLNQIGCLNVQIVNQIPTL